MPKILIVAATKLEVTPILNHFNFEASGNEGLFANHTSDNISALITGVGMVNTAFYMGKYSDKQFDYRINVGIGGSFNPNLKIGEVLNVVSDTFSEMGAEDGEEFIKLSDLNIGGQSVFKNQSKTQNARLDTIKKVNGITVNTVHGDNGSIEKVISRYHPDVESMEGAAFFRGCQGLQGNYLQIRAISNYVQKRDKSKWNIPLAVNNLNDFVIKLIEDLNIK